MSIEGVPEGWRLVRIGKPKAGEYYIENHGEACEAKPTTPTVLHWVFPIIEKIEKPKQYRHFANAAEYAPHFDRSLQPGAVLDAVMRVLKYDEAGIFVITGMGLGFVAYEDAFYGFKFTDGTPFGIEVTE